MIGGRVMRRDVNRSLLAILTSLLIMVFFTACEKEEGFPTWALSSDITASFADNGNYGFILTIEGTGKMNDFPSKKDVPWYGRSGRVTQIKVSEGITYIGGNSFSDCAAKTVMLPESVTSAGENAFSYNAKIYAYSKISDAENIYRYSETQPQGEGKYWHYVNGAAEEWEEWRDPSAGTEKILFIGNSYTYYNDMPAIFESITKGAGTDVTAESITKGSHRLYMWADLTDAEGAKVYEALRTHGDYDMIVLQEQSTYPINHYDDFLSGAKTLAKEIIKTQTDCRIFMYETWGSPKYGPNHGGIPEMEMKLRSAYENAAAAIGAKVSYVGKAFTYVYENHKDIDLYQSDDTHPTYVGSYLSACVHAASMLGIDPRTSAFDGELDASTAALMKDIAYRVVYELRD